MNDRKTHFEEVPVAVAQTVAEREFPSNANGSKKRWEDIAAELVKEQDPKKLIRLAQELHDALDAVAIRRPATR